MHLPIARSHEEVYFERRFCPIVSAHCAAEAEYFPTTLRQADLLYLDSNSVRCAKDAYFAYRSRSSEGHCNMSGWHNVELYCLLPSVHSEYHVQISGYW